MAKEMKFNWLDDKLGVRASEAAFLLNYMTSLYAEGGDEIYRDSFVLNINSAWGQGKTFFLKNLEEDIRDRNHPVIYFDAWANDFSKSPLLGFLSEIQVGLDVYSKEIPKAKDIQKSVLKNGKRILGAFAGIAANIAVKQLTGSTLEGLSEKFSLSEELVTQASDSISESAKASIDKIIDNSLKEHQELKEVISNFKKDLNHLATVLKDEGSYNLPMYILIDELDRCRPTYAIELLENIKHIFSTSGVFFVVATNKEELAHSVKAVYGSGFDSFSYLNRFFHQDYALTVPKSYDYVKFLFDKYRISTAKLFTPFSNSLNSTPDINIFIFERLTSAFKLSLRDKEQICIQLKSILLIHSDKHFQFIYLIFLLILKHLEGNGFIFQALKFRGGSYERVLDEDVLWVLDYEESSAKESKISLREVLVLYLEIKVKSHSGNHPLC